MSVRIIVKQSGKDEREHLKDLRLAQKTFERDFFALGNETKDKMQFNIDEGLHRPSTGNLKNSITLETFRTNTLSFSWGVGNIDFLNSKAPYWDWADKGGILPPITKGYFGDGEAPKGSLKGIGRQSFTHDREGFWVTPKSLTRPLNYISRTIFWFDLTVLKLGKTFGS